MSYTDFSVEQAENILGVRVESRQLFTEIKPISVSLWLSESLKKGKQNALISEKARSEFIVAPILLTVQELTENNVQIFSGQTLNVDAERGLMGECDFILTKTKPTPVLKSPIVTIVEAKKNDVDAGLGQCIAQMFGARIYNERRSESSRDIFGCVTTGETWQFLKLREDIVTVDTNRFYIDDVETILGVFKNIINHYDNI